MRNNALLLVLVLALVTGVCRAGDYDPCAVSDDSAKV
jgi:hypothetical protein